MQDDYIDCFGDPELTGKVGTDIEDNKCSWLIVQALAIASPEQRAALEVRNDSLLYYQWSSGSMPDCSARGPGIESHCGQLCLS